MTKTTDKQGRPVVAVTGMGLVTSLGLGCEDNWRALMAERSGLKTIDRFPIDGLRSSVAGTTDEYFIEGAHMSSLERSKAIGMIAAKEAYASSGLSSDKAGQAKVPGPLFMATPPSEFEWPLLKSLHEGADGEGTTGYPHMLENTSKRDDKGEGQKLQSTDISASIASAFGTTGVPITVCTACASGATAIGLGVEAIRRGEQAALCIGTDATVHQEAMVRFTLLSAVSTHNDPPQTASRPFDRTRAGFVIAEGAAALVLENYDHAFTRGAEILGIVRGYGEQADTFHRTRSMPDGSAMIGAMANTLTDAGVTPDEVDHVNAHGTSTPENDKMEALSLNELFGERILDVPVSSNKGQLGHTLLAAGAVEAVISLMTIKHGMIPSNMNFEVPDPAINLDIVSEGPRAQKVDIILSNSFGFGGQNACLVFSSGDEYA